MLTVTYTKTYNVIKFADPYIVCHRCGDWVTGTLDKSGPLMLVPCEHESDYRNVCPSWSPVDGCRCVKHLGSVEHGRPDKSAYEGQPF